MQPSEFFRCTCKDKDSQQKVHHKMHLGLSFCNNANPCNNPAHSTTHMGSHTLIYKRSFANKVEHNTHLPGISFVSWDGRGNFHCSAVMATWGSIFSNTTFALLAQKPLFISPTQALFHLPSHAKEQSLLEGVLTPGTTIHHPANPLQDAGTSPLCRKGRGDTSPPSLHHHFFSAPSASVFFAATQIWEPALSPPCFTGLPRFDRPSPARHNQRRVASICGLLDRGWQSQQGRLCRQC